MNASQFKQMRAARIAALASGSADPVAFFWEDPELTTAEGANGFEIYFNDMIDDWFGISSSMIVEALQAAGGRDVLVHVNSPGGMVFEGLAIYSAFKQYAGKVTMRVEGLAASAASFVICAGDETIIEPGAMIMIHDAWNITIGDAADHRKEADVLDKVSDSIANMYAEKSGTDSAAWRNAMVDETWYGSTEAVTAGLADSVVGDSQTDSKNAADRGPAASVPRWSGLFAKPAAQTEWDGRPDDLPPPPRDPEPEPVVEPEPEPTPEPDPEPEPEQDDTPTDLAALLAGTDLSAALRNAFPSRGVPA